MYFCLDFPEKVIYMSSYFGGGSRKLVRGMETRRRGHLTKGVLASKSV